MKKTGLRIFIITLAIISFLFSTTAEILHELFNSPGSATSEGISIVTNEGKTQEKETQEKETQEKEKEVPGETALEVHFIDVGQADCILIKASTKAFLIDGGGNGTSEAVVKYLKKQGISRLDYVLGTHPHEDHIGGLDEVINEFDIGEVYLPKVSHDTKAYENLLMSIKNKGLKILSAKAGVEFELGAGISCEMLSPIKEEYTGINNYSAVVKVTFGSTSFMFAGDVEAEAERLMLDRHYDLKADVLKVGHHGSSDSTSDEFLKAVKPVYAVISLASDNPYGYPHDKTLNKLNGTKIFRTDLNGTIIVYSDGKEISVRSEN